MRIASRRWPTWLPWRKTLAENQEAGLSFWDRIVRPDAALGRALLNMVHGQIERDEGKLLALYRREFELGATARQRFTVLEQLEFMAVILKAKGNLTRRRYWIDCGKALQG